MPPSSSSRSTSHSASRVQRRRLRWGGRSGTARRFASSNSSLFSTRIGACTSGSLPSRSVIRAKAACSSTTYRSHAVQHAINSNRRWSRERPENQAGRRTSFSSRRNRPATHLVRLRPCLCSDADHDDCLDIDGGSQHSPIALSAVARPVRRPSGSRLRRSPGRGPSARGAAHPRLSWSDESPPRCRRPARGSASDACMAQVASRDMAASAMFPCTVAKLPPWPVFRAWSRLGASAPRTSPRTTWSGRWRSAWRTKSRIVTPRSPSAPRLEPRAVGRAQPQLQLQRVLDKDDATIRWQQRAQRIQQRRLARAGAARDQRLGSRPEHGRGLVHNGGGTRPARGQLVDGEGPAAEAADGDPGCRRRWRAADGDAGTVGQTRVDDRLRVRVFAERRAIWTAARAAASVVNSGTSTSAIRPSRSTKAIPGPLIITSETASSSSAASSPGKNGFRSEMVSSIYSSSGLAGVPVGVAPAAGSPA